MKLSRKWLNEFVTVDANDKDFAEAMTLSGSKVEGTEDLGAALGHPNGSGSGPGLPRPMERQPRNYGPPCGLPLTVGRDESVQSRQSGA